MTETSSGFEGSALKPERIVRGDPLLRLLVRIKASPILIGVVYSVAFSLVRALAAWRVGHLRTTGTVTGFFDDPSLYTNMITGAVIWAYYAWLPRGISTVFTGLFANGVIDAPAPEKGKEHAYTAFMEKALAWFGRWWWSAGSLATAAIAVFTLVLPQYMEMGQSAYGTADTISLILSVLWILVGIHCALLILIYSMLAIYWLRRLFHSFTPLIRPLHPDHAGGLAPLGDFTLMLSYLIALVGIQLVLTPVTRNYITVGTWQFRWTAELVLGLGVYAITAPIVFFAPLSVAHKAMKGAKDQLLLLIARRFDAEYLKLQTALDGDTVSLESSSKTLQELQALHDMTNKFPVWPFSATNVTRFATSYALPMVLPVIVEIAGRMI